MAPAVFDHVQVIHIDADEDSGGWREHWDEWAVQPAVSAGRCPPELVAVKLSYRLVIDPILNSVLRLEHEHRDRKIALVISQLVERRWHERWLHNQRGEILVSHLARRGDKRVVIINVPWYFSF